jgi:two-component system, chemotaxis family, chemotaxis protein CheY
MAHGQKRMRRSTFVQSAAKPASIGNVAAYRTVDFRVLWLSTRFLTSIGAAAMSLKVLVADDSGVMRKILIRALNACGVTDIVEAGDGAEAISLFEKQPFDLVLTDWNMPNKTGLEVLQTIRGAGSQAPVIMITTEAESSRVKEAIAAGVTDYLAKPFENDMLRAKLDKLVCA